MSDQILNINSLQEAIKNKNCKEILNEIDSIITNKGALIQDLSVFHQLLQSDNIEILTNVSKLIAELAKTLPNRNKLSDNAIILKILQLLSIDHLNLQIQSCRALGNLCYESDSVRNVLFENEALNKIVTLLNNNLKVYYNSSNSNDDSLKENCGILRKVACGLLFNFLVSNEDIQKKALELNTINTVEQILQIEVKDIEHSEDCITHLLLVLTLILDNGGEVWITENISRSLIDILEVSTNPDVSELCLEILCGQAENGKNLIYSDFSTGLFAKNRLTKFERNHIKKTRSATFCRCSCNVSHLFVLRNSFLQNG